MGYVMFGMATMTPEGINGAVLQMFNHGTVTAMLFLFRRRDLRPRTTARSTASAARRDHAVHTGWTAHRVLRGDGPAGPSAFISEVLVLLWRLANHPALTIVSASAVVLTAGYMLWTLQRILPRQGQREVRRPAGHQRPRDLHAGAARHHRDRARRSAPVLDLINVSLVHLNQVVAGGAGRARDGRQHGAVGA